MQSYTVILEVRLHGSACGSTEDVIEAETADEAIEKAFRQWRRAQPAMTFAPLLTIKL